MSGHNVFLRGRMAQEVITNLFDNIAKHPVRSAAAFRNALICGKNFYAANPMLDLGNEPRQLFMEMMISIEKAVMEGRMIDFGTVPNAVLKAESLRARDVFEAGDLPMPYEESWLGTMAWEGGFNGYYIEPRTKGGITVLELYGINMPDGDAILLYDGVLIDRQGPGQTFLRAAPMLPAALPPGSSTAYAEQFDKMRSANALDPLVTMLRFLADASLPLSRVAAPDKLNKQRVRSGKTAIPSHAVVHTHDYVTRITHPGSNGHASHGGHHASPIAHWRRSHDRHLSGDRVVRVRSSKVNWRDGEALHRMFYSVGDSHAPQK